jgi:hypothetical protein
MARDWEQTFRSWSGPSSNAEEAKRDRTEEEIRLALKAYAPLKDRSYKVYVKGSYKNNTNVKQDSDIDICVELTEFFRYDRPSDSPNATPEQLGITPYTGDYSAAKFKHDVDIALAESFGRLKVARGPIAIKIREAKTTLPADVVPCVELHEYYFDALGHPQYRPGTRIFPDTGDTFDNYPQQQYDQGVIKNSETGKRFKQMVRILKRLENELVELGKADELPSYLTECLVYNVPNDRFGHEKYFQDMRESVAFIYNSTLADDKSAKWHEVNDIKWLFHKSQGWTRQQAFGLADAAWKYVGFV